MYNVVSSFAVLKLYSNYKQPKSEFRSPWFSSKALCGRVYYTTTVKNEFLDYIDHQNLSLGVETHYYPFIFFQLVQNKLL